MISSCVGGALGAGAAVGAGAGEGAGLDADCWRLALWTPPIIPLAIPFTMSSQPALAYDGSIIIEQMIAARRGIFFAMGNSFV